MGKGFNWRVEVTPATKSKKKLEFDMRDVQRRNPKTENNTPMHLYQRGPKKVDISSPRWFDEIKPGR